MKIANPEYSVEMIVRRMREAAAQNTVAANGDESFLPQAQSFPEDRFNPVVDIRPINLQPSFTTHPDDHYHVNDLLKFSDRHFLQNAFRAILKRPADEEGVQPLLENLRNGRLNKIDVLGQLRYSPEGREKDVEIEGLRATATLRKVYRLPVIGYLVNLAVAFIRLPALVRNQRAFENHVAVQHETLVNQINHIGRTVISEANQTADVIAQRTERVHGLEQQMQSQREQLEFLVSEHTAAHEVVLARVSELSRYLEDRLNEEVSERQTAIANFLAVADDLKREATEIVASERTRLEAIAQLQRTYNETSNGLAAMRERHQQLTSELVLQGQRVMRWLESGAEAVPLTENGKAFQEISHSLDAFFASFDEQFRGDRGEIKDRLKVYLPFVLGLTEASGRIVDLGCGRGEWLELLGEVGVLADGIDSNTVLVQQCRERGLTVIEAEMLDYLRNQPDQSFSVISGFHVVEHLPIEVLVNVLNESMRVLEPGGALIVETPNPRNVLVGTCNFYFDPTHRNPIPSEVLKFLIESRGFTRIEVLPLNPSDETPVAGESELVERFNRYFYGPMDYGIVAFKPASILPSSN